MPPPNHRLLVADDWNILFGYGEYGSAYFAENLSWRVVMTVPPGLSASA